MEFDMHLITGVVFLSCSFFTIIFALNTLYKIYKNKSFKFLKIQIILIVVFELGMCCEGVNFIDKYDIFYRNASVWVNIAEGTIFFFRLGSILLLLWNLSFMYWLSAKQLLDWIKTLKSEDDPQILVKKFSLNMLKSRKLDKVAKISIISLTFTRAAIKVFYIDQNNNESVISWILSVLDWITAILCLAILSMFFWSLKTINKLASGIEQKNLKVLYLQFTMAVLVLATILGVSIGNIFIIVK